MIKPEAGMPVIFHPQPSADNPMALIEHGFIDGMNADGSVNITVLRHAGVLRLSGVLLHQGFDGQPNPWGGYWCQFPNWFLQLMNRGPVFSANEVLISGVTQYRYDPFVPGSLHMVPVVPAGTVDPVQCGGCQPTSQVQG